MQHDKHTLQVSTLSFTIKRIHCVGKDDKHLSKQKANVNREVIILPRNFPPAPSHAMLLQ